MAKSRSVINSCVVVVFILGMLKSIIGNKGLPSLRFFFGTGLTYISLTLLDEFTDVLAKDIAIAITVYMVLNDGGSVLNELMTKAPTTTTSGSVTKNAPAQTAPTAQNPPAVSGSATGAKSTASLGSAKGISLTKGITASAPISGK